MSTSFSLNGQAVVAQAGESILEAAKREGVQIPHLCYKPGYRADGNCRACMVEIDGERVLAPSCCRAPLEGMVVQTNSPRAVKAQTMVLEMLLADMPEKALTRNDELREWAGKLGLGQATEVKRLPQRASIAADTSHPAIHVNLDACIQCTRCVRACREEQANDVIGLAMRGSMASIVFDLSDPMGASTCVACGECVQACPTGALAPANGAFTKVVDKAVESLCPYCGVGCQLTFKVKDNRIIEVQGRDGPANQSRLCVKGRYGFDYAQHPNRLTVPLIRRADAPKDPAVLARAREFAAPATWKTFFREASWEEALDVAAKGLVRIREQSPKALAGFGSAKGSNEEAYLFQKLVRTGFGSNNVDHCTRLCHASSVAALLEGIGSAAVSNPVRDVAQAQFILLIGANPTSNHPVAATWIKNAAKAGAKLVIADPRRTDLSRHAWKHLAFKPGSDVALINAMLHVILTEDLVDKTFIAQRTSGFEALIPAIMACPPEKMAKVCGIDASTLREVARAYATSSASMILWGMGISQHVHGTDNARALIAMAMSTGQIGRPGTGLHPLRGQNNVQGASDAGLIPMVYPDYQRVDQAANRDSIAKLWGVDPLVLDDQPGKTVVEIMHAAAAKEIRGMYVMGENPAMSDPDLEHARHALATLEHLVVQDIFMTETALLADVVLPASAFPEKTGTFTNTDRLVQLGRQALQSPGQARADVWIIQALAQRLGLDWNYAGENFGVAKVFEEMRQAMPSIKGISWERLEREGAVTYPCDDENTPGQRVVFMQNFPTASGRARLMPTQVQAPGEPVDTSYPWVLITGRQLEHWHTGTMTRNSEVLDALESEPVVMLHSADLAKLKKRAGQHITLRSRRGKVKLRARADDGIARGTVFLPFCYSEAAANLLTSSALDPFGKIPEFKYSAVKIS
jgi:formate dehydrogenase major subunit